MHQDTQDTGPPGGAGRSPGSAPSLVPSSPSSTPGQSPHPITFFGLHDFCLMPCLSQLAPAADTKCKAQKHPAHTHTGDIWAGRCHGASCEWKRLCTGQKLVKKPSALGVCAVVGKGCPWADSWGPGPQGGGSWLILAGKARVWKPTEVQGATAWPAGWQGPGSLPGFPAPGPCSTP